MSEVTRSVDIAAPIEKVFDTITDFESYPSFLGHLGMVGVEVQQQQQDQKLVKHAVKKMGTTVHYTLRYHLERPNKIEWSFVEGQMMKDNHGSWVLERVGENSTRANYSVEVKFGLLVPGALVKAMISNELPQMLNAFKNRAEGK